MVRLRRSRGWCGRKGIRTGWLRRFRNSCGRPPDCRSPDVHSMEEVVSLSAARQRFNMLLMTVFGCVALLLAAIGIYGLMAYSVEQRTQEIGIRLALGAEASQVRNMVVREWDWRWREFLQGLGRLGLSLDREPAVRSEGAIPWCSPQFRWCWAWWRYSLCGFRPIEPRG